MTGDGRSASKGASRSAGKGASNGGSPVPAIGVIMVAFSGRTIVTATPTTPTTRGDVP